MRKHFESVAETAFDASGENCSERYIFWKKKEFVFLLGI